MTGNGIFRADGQPDDAGIPKGPGADIGERRLHGRSPIAPALVLNVDHQMPDEIGLFVIVIDDHQISDHFTGAADRKGGTLPAVYIRLGQASDGVGYKLFLLGIQFQGKAGEKIGFIHVLQGNTVHTSSFNAEG